MKERGLFLITIIAILVLSFASYSQLKKFRETPFSLELPEINSPDFNLSSIPENVEDVEFTSPDNKLKLTYNNSWMKLNLEELMKQFYQSATSTESISLLSLQKFNLQESSFAFLTVQQFNAENATGAEAFLEELKNQSQDKMKITMSTGTDQILLFEADYLKNGLLAFHSREKIIFDENKAYLVSIIAPGKDWQNLKQEAEIIIDSVQLIE